MVVRLVANQNTRVRFPLPAQSNKKTPYKGVFLFALDSAPTRNRTSIRGSAILRSIH